MKLRGLSPNTLVIALAVLLLGGALYLKTKKNSLSDDIKSQLTSVTSPENKPKGLKALIAGNLQKQEEMVERKEFDDSVLAQERFYTEKEINDMTEEQFSAVLKDIELKMPKLSDIKKLPPGALHHIPVPVMQAGKDMGLIKEILKVHESYTRVATGFYEECAKNSERPTSVRALCLTNLIIEKKKNGEKIKTAEYPDELVNLTKMVTDL